MQTNRRGHDQLLAGWVALVVGVLAAPGPAARGSGDGGAVLPPPGPKKKDVKGLFGHRDVGQGTLGYGPPGIYPGFQGFGLGYHLGYGYGGAARGVGAEGGYPLYGGPGYPHPGPALRRLPLTAIEPFCFHGGPGGPTPSQPNFFGGVGPLTPDNPVVRPGNDSPDSTNETGYGMFDGTLPYPEQTFAPFSGAGGDPANDATPFNNDPAPPPPPPPPPPSTTPAAAPDPAIRPTGGAGSAFPRDPQAIGVDAQPVVKADGERGLLVIRIHPGAGVDQLGIAPGDLIRSANGYGTERADHLAWIIAHAAPDRILKLDIRTAKSGELRTVMARLR